MRRIAQIVFFTILSLLLSSVSISAESVDERLYKLLHDSYRSPAMDALMETATYLGDRKSGLGFCLIFSTYGRKYEKETAKLAFTSLTTTGAAAAILKFSINRRRPEGSHSRHNSSFPSGHATGAFAMATVLASRYPKYRFLSYTTASVIALSRVYLGRHYPSDVIAGALLGYIGSKTVLHFKSGILPFEF